MASLLALGAPASALQRPSGKVALTLRGKVQTTNQGGQAVFDLAMLAELPQKQFTGMTHWEKTPLKFGGPLLRDVFAAAQVTGTQVHATASDGYRVSFPKVNTPPTVTPFAPMDWLPIPVFDAQTPPTLLALVLVPLIAWLLYRTPIGLAVRMVGENPQAAEGQGVSVAAVRTGAIVAGSALMGVAGSFLTLSAFNAFFFNMINGRGWICVALVVFAAWQPGKALVGALLFAFFDALQLRLQQSGDAVLPYQFYLMLPYVLSIVALILVARRATYPQALMKPYRKGER